MSLRRKGRDCGYDNWITCVVIFVKHCEIVKSVYFRFMSSYHFFIYMPNDAIFELLTMHPFFLHFHRLRQLMERRNCMQAYTYEHVFSHFHRFPQLMSRRNCIQEYTYEQVFFSSFPQIDTAHG